MNSRERMMIALENGRPDRLPCQVHGWMDYYLKTYLDGADWYQACEKFDLDYAIYTSPRYIYSEKDLTGWEVKRKDLGPNEQGDYLWQETIITPGGALHHAGAKNQFTEWETDFIIKNERDFELWNEFFPLPGNIDMSPVHAEHEKVANRGIVRSHPFSFGQGSPWQSFCCLFGVEQSILLGMDNPDFLHRVLESLLDKTLKVTEMWEGTSADVVELGGGAGSSTVISPKFFEEFCLPYDIEQINAFHDIGVKVVYHLCGGMMPMLDLVIKTGADGLETMTPSAMGGDCDLSKASQQIGNKIFFIGGFDQNKGFENGTPSQVRQMVFDCFEATKDNAGYIIAPSDHFFFGEPENIKAFADTCKECVY